ncbi:MAG: sulfatase-like hydrolase/transferase [Bryobacterales bacterium]|nr:sulfatase-like hydrolase/transferase [Bryobacterales bacterium]
MSLPLRRREFLSLAGGLALPTAKLRPNFLIVLCDDLGYGDLGCYGNQRILTPNLDRLASEGIRFTDCYCAAPVCSPARAAMLTGLVPDRTGVCNWIPEGSVMHLGPNYVTFAQLLRRAGYATCHVGKWHCNGKFNSAVQPQPSDHGFDHWFSTQNNAAPSHADPVNFVRNGKPVGPLKGNASTLIVEEAIRWLRRLPAGKPFCLFLCFHAPHEPIAADGEFLRLYSERSQPGEALYYASVTQMGHEFGRLMRYLDESGHGAETLVFFTSDNGPERLNRYKGAWRSYGSAGPLRGMKLDVYEGGIRVPGLLRWPGRVRPNRVVSDPISGVDILPTLCAAAGIPSPAGLDGTSILPALEGKPLDRHKPLYWHYYNALSRPKAALRSGNWKILGIPDRALPRSAGGPFQPAEDMRYIKETRLVAFELYDLSADMAERNDLAAREAGLRRRLAEELVAFYREVQERCPVWE